MEFGFFIENIHGTMSQKKLTLFISMCLETWCRLNQINICSCQALVFLLQFSVDFNTCLFTNGAKAFRLLNPETIHHFMWNFRTWLMIVLCSYHPDWIEWTFVYKTKHLQMKKATCYHKYCCETFPAYILFW